MLRALCKLGVSVFDGFRIFFNPIPREKRDPSTGGDARSEQKLSQGLRMGCKMPGSETSTLNPKP